jgi:LuxR family maltose regulon positive regulatory protein
MQKADTLIHTKLHLPFTRLGLVSRPRLQEQITQGLCGPLTLITAPAGFGKTILVASCVAGCGMPVAWLSLDKDDNQVGRFLNYLVAALQEADPAIGNEAVQLLAASQPAPPKAVLTSLINDLDTADGEIALVLDDYQFISSQAVHEAAAFLLEHCPRTFHLVIATRSDPPLPVVRLRARGQVVELRASDLGFSESEAAQFLNDVMGLNLDAGSVAALAERTEGWIAGLQMAALSMQGRKDIPQFIQAFSGSHHYILDYLIEEVLNRQPKNIKEFLIRTSILDRLCGPLCDAVLDPVGTPTGQLILEQMERENLFLISLDDERRWFRYHHLFADLLHTRLDHLHHADLPKLHLRASAWYEQNQWMEEAVNHALSARDLSQAGRLINQLAESKIAQSGSFELMQWIQKLPDQYVRTQPWMCIALGWAYGLRGLLAEQEDYLKEAENHILPGDPPLLQKSWRAQILTLRSLVANTLGDFTTSIRLSRQALELIPEENVSVRIVVGYNLGRTYVTLGDYARAEEVLWETARLCMESGINHILAPNIAVMSKGYRLQGRLHDVVEKLRPLHRYLEAHNPKSIHAASYAYLGNIDVLREWNQLEQAEELARSTLESLEPWNSQNCTCACATLLARILQAEGKLEEAYRVLQFANQVIERNVPFVDIRSDLNSAWVKYWLAIGELPLAEHWMEEWLRIHAPGEDYSITVEQDEISLSRVLIAKQKYQAVAPILSRLAESAEAGGRIGRLIEIQVLQAVALCGQEKDSEALNVLEKCLTLARPEGYMRVFLDSGGPMRECLSAYLRTPAPAYRNYVQELLDVFYRTSKGPLPEKARTDLVESLTPRELEVLQLIAMGRTNPEIARQLIVAPGTVKAHTASIYRKLDVANRTEAVARARQLGLLP